MFYEIYYLNINSFSAFKWKSKCKQISWKTKRMFLTVHVENPSIFSTVSVVNAPPVWMGKTIVNVFVLSVSVRWVCIGTFDVYTYWRIFGEHTHTRSLFVVRIHPLTLSFQLTAQYEPIGMSLSLLHYLMFSMLWPAPYTAQRYTHQYKLHTYISIASSTFL